MRAWADRGRHHIDFDRTVLTFESLSSMVAHLALGRSLFPGIQETHRSFLPSFWMIKKRAIATK